MSLTDEQMSRMLAMAAEVHKPGFQERLAEREAQRTDPWRWYCRLCGAEGAACDPETRNRTARAHVDDGQPCGQGHIKAEAASGRLLHVWSF